MIEPVRLWPDLIYKAHCPLDLSAVSSFCHDRFSPDAVHGLEKAGGLTTFNTCNNLIFEKECDDLRQWIATIGDSVWKQWNFATDLPRYIHRSWVNLHPPGAYTDEHDHGQCHQTVVIYLKQPQHGGNILFKDPMQYVFSGFPKIDRNAWAAVDVVQNDVLFFPGFLHHMTEPNASAENRLVMTVTVSVDIFNRS